MLLFNHVNSFGSSNTLVVPTDGSSMILQTETKESYLTTLLVQADAKVVPDVFPCCCHLGLISGAWCSKGNGTVTFFDQCFVIMIQYVFGTKGLGTHDSFFSEGLVLPAFARLYFAMYAWWLWKAVLFLCSSAIENPAIQFKRTTSIPPLRCQSSWLLPGLQNSWQWKVPPLADWHMWMSIHV